MNLRTAESYLPCYRAGKHMDACILKAARLAESDGALREKLRAQMDFDAQIADVIHSIPPPDKLFERLDASLAGATPTLRKQAGHPTILCAIAGVILIVGFLVYMQLDRLAHFPGKENVERMVDQLNGMSGVELEPARGTAGGLGDWFYLRGFEGFVLSPEVAALPAMGARTFKIGGSTVSQLLIDRHNSILNVFRASDFNVRLEHENDWTIFEQEGWAAAIQQKQDICMLLAFRGNREEMEKFVSALKP